MPEDDMFGSRCRAVGILSAPTAEVGCSQFMALVATGAIRGAGHTSQSLVLWLVNLSFLHAVGKMSLREPLLSQRSLV